eukprot:gene12967-15330_t
MIGLSREKALLAVAPRSALMSCVDGNSKRVSAFLSAYYRDSPDFQVSFYPGLSGELEHGYPVDGPNEANMKVCSNAVGQRFNCLSMTLEMPFKDNDNLPDQAQGWSPERAMRFGSAVLGAMREVLPMLGP